ncbi:MAG: DUF1731 domain-containing protein [Bifidobacteriaceae bacterium]|nr:DUF1731 domain-containing protein [Bifidobacteriaceae bacterium]
MLASQQVRPVKLLEHGFQFRHPTAAAALRETL